jgi:hypothetical protein
VRTVDVVEILTPQPGAPAAREPLVRRALLAIGHHAPKIMIALVAVAIAQASIGLWVNDDVVLTISLALYVLAATPALVLVLVGMKLHRDGRCERDWTSDPSRLRELSPLAYLGFQLETGQVERFPPRFPDDGDGRTTDVDSGGAVGGS